MNNSYNNLQTFNFGKRVYVVMKNNYSVVYFENSGGNFSRDITSFNLYDNEGKSLTLVNQHFFMNELVNRINVACKKGFFVTDKEIIDYLTGIKNKAESDVRLKQLFKGSLMKEINEANFESNKREIISYLDGFKYDDFSYYDNVSVFSGSIDKNNSVNLNNSKTEVVDESSQVSNFDFSSHQFDDADNKSGISSIINNIGGQADNKNGEVVDDLHEVGNNVAHDNINLLSENNSTSVVNQAGSNVFNVNPNNSLQDNQISVQDNVLVNDVNDDQTVDNNFDVNAGFNNTVSQDVFNQVNVQNSMLVNDVNDDQTVNNNFDVNTGFNNTVLQDNFNQMNLSSVVNQNDLSNVQDVYKTTDNQVGNNDVNSNFDNSSFETNFKQTDQSSVVNQNDLSSVQNGVYAYENIEGNINQSINNGISQDGFSQMNENAFSTNNSLNVPQQDVNVQVSNDLSDSIQTDIPVVESMSYIDQVKSRIQNNTPQVVSSVKQFDNEPAADHNINREYGKERIDNTIIQDSSMLPDLESLDVVKDDSSKSNEKPKKKKSNIGIVIFIIVLIGVLIGFGFYLYNVVF